MPHPNCTRNPWPLVTRAAIAAEKPEKLRIAYITISGSMAAVWTAAASGNSRKKRSKSSLFIFKLSLQSPRPWPGIDAVEIPAPGIVPVVLPGGI